MATTYPLKEIINKINKEILGIPQHGFEDERLWGDEFRNKYFFREGEINGEYYSSNINQILSGAAMSHTLDEIRKRLQQMLEKENS